MTVHHDVKQSCPPLWRPAQISQRKEGCFRVSMFEDTMLIGAALQRTCTSSLLYVLMLLADCMHVLLCRDLAIQGPQEDFRAELWCGGLHRLGL